MARGTTIPLEAVDREPAIDGELAEWGSPAIGWGLLQQNLDKAEFGVAPPGRSRSIVIKKVIGGRYGSTSIIAGLDSPVTRFRGYGITTGARGVVSIQPARIPRRTASHARGFSRDRRDLRRRGRSSSSILTATRRLQRTRCTGGWSG